MPSFKSCVLINLQDICNKLPKSPEEVTKEYLRGLYEGNLDFEFSFGDPFSGNLSGCSFNSLIIPKVDDAGILFGSIDKEGIVKQAKKMPEKIREKAISLVAKTPFNGERIGPELFGKIMADNKEYGANAYRIVMAINMLYGKPTLESPVMTFYDNAFRSLPGEKVLDEVEKDPENWAILPMWICY